MLRDLRKRISDELLPRVENPSQYIGLETHACCADVDSAKVTAVMAFPDTYAIGISHSGSQILYRLANTIPGVACDRAYCPLPDAEAVCREINLPLFGWESRRALADFDVLGFSLGYEICATNVLTMLDLAGVCLHADRRGRTDPLVVAGDALADSPEPMAGFFDVFLPGDGEGPWRGLLELLRDLKSGPDQPTRGELLRQIALRVPSAYVPSLYEPRIDSAGRYAGLQPLHADLPLPIDRACLTDLDATPLPARPLVPVAEGVHDRVTLEIMRGCPNGCRFCQAGATRLPLRWRPVEQIVDAAREAIENTGYREISLLSLSTSDYPRLTELLAGLRAALPDDVSISLPSLRVDTQLEMLAAESATVRKTGITIAAEAGSERLRLALNKGITEEDMLAGVSAAWRAGYHAVKVYFIAGLPGETDEDVDEIFHLCRRLSDSRRAIDGQRGSINASVSWFVPKPHTPMQWLPMAGEERFWQIRNRLRQLCHRNPVNVKFHLIERSCLEGYLARADRRAGQVILEAWRRGARLDAWGEHWNWRLWQEAFEATGTDWSDLITRELDPYQPVPWDHIRCHRSPEALRHQHERYRQAAP
jgi:radical SAM family uncharacterized protein